MGVTWSLPVSTAGRAAVAEAFAASVRERNISLTCSNLHALPYQVTGQVP